MTNPQAVAPLLLAWYDRHRRALPWRALPGTTADPYRVWLSEVMLQQTTVAAVKPRFEAWVARWPDFASLAAADDADVMATWAGLGYYARARNLVAAAKAVVADHGGAFPTDEATLRTLPGLGAYTAAAVAAIAFGRRAVVVDANVERVVARLFAIRDPLPGARVAIRAATDRVTPDARAGDFAQAMMDLGSGICTPRAPSCLLCPLNAECAGYRQGAPERLPAKATKKAKPRRYGTIFWVQRGDDVLLVRRPDKGLLGGMRALPTGPWVEVAPALDGAPVDAEWAMRNVAVSHGFTHFDIELTLAVAMGQAHHAVDGEWWPIADLDRAGLPTLFAKAAAAILRRDA
ncbi:A/G-specific adenine glycosylase [Sphingomonas insulae]|uniref:Adenine DNA glycosylase n=1 Tax=Sphingomonas insulae TaxID=424800 RepID=A0ABN1I0Y9_9SPHN|nr:A/G-specific adenine glycosylase [Sphingomonas insulae]